VKRKSRRCVTSALVKKFFHRQPFRGIASTVNRSKTSESVRKPIRCDVLTSGVEASNDACDDVVVRRLDDPAGDVRCQ
jgi:hypothetical protein